MKLTLFDHPSGDRPLAALGLLLMGVFALALQDSLVKLMSGDTSFWQFQTLRSIGNLSFIVILALASGSLGLMMPRNWRPVYLRGALLTVCMFCFFAGAPYLTVPQMAAGLYTYPLFVSLLAGPILGESVGPWRICALLVGATGAAFILSPWQDDFSAVQLLPIMAGFFYATNILTLRRACRNESPLALAFAVGVVFIVSGVAGIALLSAFPLPAEIREAMPFVAIGWPELTFLVAGFALFASVLNLTGNICLSRAYQTADASWLAPMDFSYLIFAALWSRAIFDQWPTRQAIIGMALIGTAGIITAWRERVVATGRRINQ
ncbi:MAG: DMT family transporter [Gammaproteobacteria bacterium]